jgi:hypothetical protein
MKRRGRPGLGVRHADALDGSGDAKERLALILETVTGERSVADAAAALDVSEAHFHRLRERALQGAVQALEPRPSGRPAAVVDAKEERIVELEEALAMRDIELRAAQLREEIALVMPHLYDKKKPRSGADKKKRATRRAARRARRNNR